MHFPCPEQHKMRSQLAAQFMPFFRLIARILTFRDKKYRILTFCNKTELYLTVLQQNNVEACLRCEASLSFVPSLPQAPYCSPNLRTTSSLGSQGPCSARSGAAALQHFLLLCWSGVPTKYSGQMRNLTNTPPSSQAPHHSTKYVLSLL